MKIWEKLILWSTWLAGMGVMLILPIYSIWTGLIVGQVEKVKFNLMTGVILLLIGIVFSGWIMKVYNRKLQAIATVEELGQVPVTHFVITRILKMAEILIPLAALAFIFRGITNAEIRIPAHIIMRDIIIWVTFGFIILILHDYLKTNFTNRKIVNDALKLDIKKEKLKRKRLKEIRHRRGE